MKYICIISPNLRMIRLTAACCCTLIPLTCCQMKCGQVLCRIKKFENINIKKLNGKERKKERLVFSSTSEPGHTTHHKRFDFLMLDFDLKEPYLNVNSNTYFCLPVCRRRFHNTIHANLVHGWRGSSSIPYVFMFHSRLFFMLYYVCKCH